MHNKLLPNLAASNTNIYYLSVSEGQESGSGVVGWFGSESLVRLLLSCWLSLRLIWRLTWGSMTALKVIHLTLGRKPQFLTGICWRPQFFTTWPSPAAAGWRGNCFPPEQVTQEREPPREKSNVFYKLLLKMTYHYFCHIMLVTQTNPGTMWEQIMKGCCPRR